MSRMDVIAFRKGANDKTYAVRLGSAVPKKQGEGYTLYLDAIPAPENGQWVISVVPPREQRQQSNQQQRGAGDPPPF
jgi:hypothetical protein